MIEQINQAIRLLELEQYPRTAVAIANTVIAMDSSACAFSVRRALRRPNYVLKPGGWAINV